MTPILSTHARKQAQSRSISEQVISLIDREADIRKWCRKGCETLQISKHRLRQLQLEGDISPEMVERANGVYLVTAMDGTIVTACHKCRRFKSPKCRRRGKRRNSKTIH